MVVGGLDDNSKARVEMYPSLTAACSIPEIPFRMQHSLSVLSDGTFVICGGRDLTDSLCLDSCISWISGNTTWAPLPRYTMR